MRVITLFGTRPEIIRLSQVTKILDTLCDQLLIYTGQNYDTSLSDVFFQELQVRQPDIDFQIRATSFTDQVAQILRKAGEAFDKHRPDRLLILGDTNSGLSSLVAARMRIPVFHMEAGNRCYDDRVPEEINRRVIDHCSNVLMPYTERSKENLLREGIQRERIFVTGNPIYEVLQTHAASIQASDVLRRLDVEPHKYFLVTLHRAENVDEARRLDSFFEGVSLVAEKYEFPAIVSVHPRTADKLDRFGLAPSSKAVRLMPPLGFFDFVALEQNSFCVLSDSGTVQEECAIFHVPNVTLRDVTERPETIECGSNIISGPDPKRILASVRVALTTSRDWQPPPEYIRTNVARTVAKIVLGYSHELERNA